MRFQDSEVFEVGVDLRKILVIDLEATCWKEQPERQRLNSEIIEIGGAVLSTDSLEITDTLDLYCWPLTNPNGEMTEFCTELTGITEDHLEKEGRPFIDQCQSLQRYCLENGISTWASWGNYDRAMFVDQCVDLEVSYPLPFNHINIKILEAMVCGRRGGKGTARALRGWGLEFEGRQHNGLVDAINTAKLFARILSRGRSE